MNEEALGKKIKALRISNVENNRVAMSLRVLIYYAKLTGVTLDYLVGMVDSDYQETLSKLTGNGLFSLVNFAFTPRDSLATRSFTQALSP